MVMKDCCSKCGFPKDMPRDPVFITNNMLSMATYLTNKCEECGHQSDGTTIPVINKKLQEIVTRYVKFEDALIKFFKHYNRLDEEQRKEVCVYLPKFMKPNYKSTGDDTIDEMKEPYSWNVVYIETTNKTKLSQVMIRDIDWDKIEEEL